MGYENNLHEHNLCTINEKGVSVCNGDSGGPLAYDSGTRTKTLIGIVSWSASGVSIIFEILELSVFKIILRYHTKCNDLLISVRK